MGRKYEKKLVLCERWKVYIGYKSSQKLSCLVEMGLSCLKFQYQPLAVFRLLTEVFPDAPRWACVFADFPVIVVRHG